MNNTVHVLIVVPFLAPSLGFAPINRFILDGFPRNFAEGFSLFAQRDDAADLEAADPESFEGDAAITPDAAVLPQSVIVFTAAADVLEKRVCVLLTSLVSAGLCAPCACKCTCVERDLALVRSCGRVNARLQVMALPEAQVLGTHNDALSFRRRLARYNAENKLDAASDTVTFFEEKCLLSLLSVAVDLDTDITTSVNDVLAPYIERNGSSFNYHPTAEEIADAERAEKAAEVCGSLTRAWELQPGLV